MPPPAVSPVSWRAFRITAGFASTAVTTSGPAGRISTQPPSRFAPRRVRRTTSVVDLAWRLWIPLRRSLSPRELLARAAPAAALPQTPRSAGHRRSARGPGRVYAAIVALVAGSRPAPGSARSPSSSALRSRTAAPQPARATCRQHVSGGEARPPVPCPRAGRFTRSLRLPGGSRGCCTSTPTSCTTCIRSCPAITCADSGISRRTKSSWWEGPPRQALRAGAAVPEPRRVRMGSVARRRWIRSQCAALFGIWRSCSRAWRRRLVRDGRVAARSRSRSTAASCARPPALRRQQDVARLHRHGSRRGDAFAAVALVAPRVARARGRSGLSRRLAYAALGAWPAVRLHGSASCRTRSSSGSSASSPARRGRAARRAVRRRLARLRPRDARRGQPRRTSVRGGTGSSSCCVGPAIHWAFSASCSSSAQTTGGVTTSLLSCCNGRHPSWSIRRPSHAATGRRARRRKRAQPGAAVRRPDSRFLTASSSQTRPYDVPRPAELHSDRRADRELPGKSRTGRRAAPAETITALIVDAPLPEDVRSALRPAICQPRCAAPLIVRSSAVGEDSRAASFAGQLDSIAGITPGDALEQAHRPGVGVALVGARAGLPAARGVKLAGMGVIVQRQIDAQLSGVLFTRLPKPDRRDADRVLRAAWARRSSAGRRSRHASRSSRRDCRWLVQCRPSGRAPDAHLLTQRHHRSRRWPRSAWRSKRLRRAAGHRVDDRRATAQLWIVQARPITTPVEGAAVRRPRPCRWSNANVNENFPRADLAAALLDRPRRLLPLLPQSRSRLRDLADDVSRDGPAAAPDHRRARRADVLQPDSIHAVLRSAPFGDLLAASFNQFVGAEQADDRGQGRPSHGRGLGRPRQTRRSSRCIAAKTAWQYLFLTRRVERSSDRVDAFAARTHPDAPAAAVRCGAAATISRLPRHPLPPLEDASLADAGSMVCYGAAAAAASRARFRQGPAGAAQLPAQGAARIWSAASRL